MRLFARSSQPIALCRRPRQPDRELVVACHSEDVSWLAAVPPESADAITLYDMADQVVVTGRARRLLAGRCSRVRLPNRGREACAYLAHIVCHYNRLARLTFFVQADAPHHQPDVLRRLAEDHEQPTTLTERYDPHYYMPALTDHDRVEVTSSGLLVRYGDYRRFLIGDLAVLLLGSLWGHVFACAAPGPWWFGYAAHWAVPRRAIQGRPRSFWRWLLAELGRCPATNDERAVLSRWLVTPWSLESLWYYLWQEPALYPHRPDRARSRLDFSRTLLPWTS